MRRLIAPTLAVIALLAGLLVAPAASAVEQTVVADAATAMDVEAALDAETAIGDSIQTADLSKFQAGNIISDAVFYDTATMTEAQIQAFLEKRVPTCRSGYTCLKDWYDTSRSMAADAVCKAYSGGTRERASRIIYKVAQACGINPQVLLVMLQKEQSLVDHVWPSDWRFDIAMGATCSDTSGCEDDSYGFFNQMYKGAWDLKRYSNPSGTSQYFTWYAPGKTWNILWNPNRDCGSSPVYVQNQATANLYYYTPYQPNAAAIRAGYGTGDGCSSYGNRNFYQYFTDWFGSTQSQVPDATDTPFADVSSAKGSSVYNVFASDIVWLSEQGISEGWVTSGGWREYRPYESVKRDVMAAFLYRMAGSPAYTAPARSSFVDVSPGAPFYKEISWLASSGISTGWKRSDGTWEFRPTTAVNRDVMAAFLYRFAGEPDWDGPEGQAFRDVSSSAPFFDEIAWLAETGISTGWIVGGSSEFRPTAAVNRDVMAAFLHRLHGVQNPFIDVSSIEGAPAYNVFAADIAWLASRGISQGWSRADGTREFRPAEPVIREAMAAFLYRLAGEPAFTPPTVSPFADVPVGRAFYGEITWLASTGVSTGWKNTDGVWEFRPNEAVARDVMSAFLYRYAGSPDYTPPVSSPFVDVATDHRFYKEIAWMNDTGVSTGWAVDGLGQEFRPTVAVNRDVMAAFLHRLDLLLR